MLRISTDQVSVLNLWESVASVSSVCDCWFQNPLSEPLFYSMRYLSCFSDISSQACRLYSESALEFLHHNNGHIIILLGSTNKMGDVLQDGRDDLRCALCWICA